jgi:hypothetical protein
LRLNLYVKKPCGKTECNSEKSALTGNKKSSLQNGLNRSLQAVIFAV